MSAHRAGLRRAGRIHLHHKAGLVLQVAFQPAPAGGEFLPVESGLGLDVRVGLLNRAPRILRHGLDVRSLDHHGMRRVRQLATVPMGGVRAPSLLPAVQLAQRPARAAPGWTAVARAARNVPGPWPSGAACTCCWRPGCPAVSTPSDAGPCPPSTTARPWARPPGTDGGAPSQPHRSQPGNVQPVAVHPHLAREGETVSLVPMPALAPRKMLQRAIGLAPRRAPCRTPGPRTRPLRARPGTPRGRKSRRGPSQTACTWTARSYSDPPFAVFALPGSRSTTRSPGACGTRGGPSCCSPRTDSRRSGWSPAAVKPQPVPFAADGGRNVGGGRWPSELPGCLSTPLCGLCPMVGTARLRPLPSQCPLSTYRYQLK